MLETTHYYPLQIAFPGARMYFIVRFFERAVQYYVLSNNFIEEYCVAWKCVHYTRVIFENEGLLF